MHPYANSDTNPWYRPSPTDSSCTTDIPHDDVPLGATYLQRTDWRMQTHVAHTRLRARAHCRAHAWCTGDMRVAPGLLHARSRHRARKWEHTIAHTLFSRWTENQDVPARTYESAMSAGRRLSSPHAAPVQPRSQTQPALPPPLGTTHSPLSEQSRSELHPPAKPAVPPLVTAAACSLGSECAQLATSCDAISMNAPEPRAMAIVCARFQRSFEVGRGVWQRANGMQHSANACKN